MPEDLEQALLSAIHDNPADETPWLVLGDWLEERGDPRAELLRLQQALRGEMDDETRRKRERQVRRLLRAGVAPVAPVRVNSIGMELVLIRPGVFWMGSPLEEEGRYHDEGPRHRVRITRPFYLGRYPVTQEEYQRVLGITRGHFRPGGEGDEVVAGLDTRQFPVDSVSWLDALAFCDALSARVSEQGVYRLPSEAEWEYACRAGASSDAPFSFGHSLSSRQANFDGTAPYGGGDLGPNLRRTCAVGSYPPNAFGLYDMHGNVWEWTADWFDEDYYDQSPEEDPPGSLGGDSRVLRGGSFYYTASSCRSAIRFARRPNERSWLDGFRVAVSLAEDGEAT